MAPYPFTTFIGRQFTTLPEVKPIDLTGKNVIVTGSNIGLGKEAANHFAIMNPAKLILAVRTVSKGQEAADEIKRRTGCKNVEVWQLDQSDFSSVKAFLEKASKLDRLDIALFNAGINNFTKWETTKDGYEATIQVNDISTTWLALGLLPLLKETASKSSDFKPHLTIVGSDVHYWAKFKGHETEQPLAYLNNKATFEATDRYNVSKLINLFMAREIGKVAGDSVNVNVVNPGLCHSSLSRSMTGIVSILFTIFSNLLARTTEVGSRNFIWATLNNTPSGAFVSDCQLTEESDFALSDAGYKAQAKVWKELVDIVKKQDPSIKA